MSRYQRTMQAMLAGLLFSSCTTPGFPDKNVAGPGPADVEVVERPEDRTCDAGKHRALIGRSIEKIDVAALPQPLRVYPAGSRITMDYRPERLNIVIGPNGRVAKVKCG